MKPILLILLLSLTTSALAQRGFSADKSIYQWGVDLNFGASFPDIPKNQDHWSAGAYTAVVWSVFVSRLVHKSLFVELRAGGTSYNLINKNESERYTLDFITPFASSAITYKYSTNRKYDVVGRLGAGAQLGYTESFTDFTNTYDVYIQGNGMFTPFSRAEIGIRRVVPDWKIKRYARMTIELTAFYRHNFRRLGSARFVTPTYDITIRPRGSIAGLSLRMLLPLGQQRIKGPKPEPEVKPPVRRSPRTLQ